MELTTPLASSPAPRLAPDRALPPYAFVPRGHWPHPVRDPRGHSHGHVPTAEPLLPEKWWTNSTYLFGFDLLNHGFYWEAHEAWEVLWRMALRQDHVLAVFLKGLIKLAAAGVKVREGVAAGVGSHAGRAAELFDEAAVLTHAINYCGCDLADLSRRAREVERRQPKDDDTLPHANHCVFAFTIIPRMPSEHRHV